MSLATEYLQSVEVTDNRNTWLARRNDVGQLVDFLRGDAALDGDGDVLWSEVEPHHARSFVNWLKARGYTMLTIARKVSLARCFLTWLIDDKQVALSPVLEALPPIRQSDFAAVNPVPVFSIDDVRRLVDMPESIRRRMWFRDSAMIAVLAETACLSTELLTLKMIDVNIVDRTIFFHGTVKLPRNVQCDGPFWDIISQYWQMQRDAERRDDHYLFVRCTNLPMTRAGLWLNVSGYGKQAGLAGMTPMSLRYSIIRHWQSIGRSDEQIALDLGVFLTSNLRHSTLARSG